jgi:hypothetical protein
LGTFNLAFHAWDEPPERVWTAVREAQVELALPRPGQAIGPDARPPLEQWWRVVGKME